MRAIWLLAVLLLAPQAKAKSARVSKRALKSNAPTFYLLSVGVDNYADAFWTDLRWAKQDAEAVAGSVGQASQYRKKVKLLVDEQASLSAIKSQLNDWKKKARPQDVIMIYISSHGSLYSGSRGELEPVVVLSKTKPNNIGQTGLKHAEIASLLEGFAPKRKLLVFASCHSGLGKSRLPDQIREQLAGQKGKVVDLESVSEGMIVLSAASKGESAREDRSLSGDIYTHFFLQALDTYDRNKDGVVSAIEAHDYARERTYRFTGGRQRPTMKAELIGSGDVPLRGRRVGEGLPILEGYEEAYAGIEVSVDKGKKGQLPNAFPLKDGASIVRMYPEGSDEPMAVFKVNADKGDSVSVEDLFSPQPYQVGLFAGAKEFSDRKFRKIYGSGIDALLGVQVRAEWRRAYTSLFATSQSEGSAEIWSGLDSELTQYYYGMGAGYQHYYPFGFGIGGGLNLGFDQAKLTFKDYSTGTKVSEKASPMFYGLTVNFSYELNSHLRLQHDVMYHWVEYDFGRFGKVDANRFVGHFGFYYTFGHFVRRVK